MCTLRVAIAALFIFICSTFAYASENSWDKVRYNGGSLTTKVDPHEWDNRLTVTSDLITFELKDGQKVEISTRNVTGLSYGQEAHRRVVTMVVLFGVFHKTRLHYIGVEYTANGKKAGLLLQGDKDDYQAILLALKNATHAPITVSDKDRGALPETLQANVVKESGDNDEPAKTAEKPAAGTLSLTSDPPGADVYINNDLAGKTPCTLTLDPGKHTVKVIARGYLTWSRELKVREGTELTLNADLEK